jgi:hypothetical protein
MTNTNSNLKPTVGAIRKSMAAMPAALVVEKRLPGLPPPRRVFGDGLFRDFESELH